MSKSEVQSLRTPLSLDLFFVQSSRSSRSLASVAPCTGCRPDENEFSLNLNEKLNAFMTVHPSVPRLFLGAPKLRLHIDPRVI